MDDSARNTNRVLALVFVFGSLALMLLLGLGIGIVNQLSRQPAPIVLASPTPAPDLIIADPDVRGGGVFTVFGADWPPNQIIFLFVGDPAQPADRLAILSGQTSSTGAFALRPIYPNDPRWTSLATVNVIAQTGDQRLEVTQPVAVSSATPVPTFTPSPTTIAATATPTLSPTPTPSPTTAITDWRGEYFNNLSLSGTPSLIRNDAQVRFNWGNAWPDPGLPADNFSARWTRTLTFSGGVYRFKISGDDGLRFYINDAPMIDEWHAYTGQTYSREINLAAGVHSLRVELYEAGGLAAIDFSYEPLINFTDWKGEYFANRDLSGSPAVTRNDAALNFDWGGGSPDQRLPADGFSARWTRTLNFAAGVIRFVVRADDGVRLMVDGSRLIDEWHDSALATYTRDVTLSAGAHVITLEYFEDLGQASLSFGVQPTSFAAWKGEYFSNRDLSGAPALVRDEAALDFNWGDGSPAPEAPADNFSARWSRTLNFDAGIYLFSLIVDDGARLYLDDVRMIDEWHDGSTTYSFTTVLSSGAHTLRVEYYEHTQQARAGLTWARLLNTPSPTVTPTASATPTFTPTPTSSPTFTPTITATATGTSTSVAP